MQWETATPVGFPVAWIFGKVRTNPAPVPAPLMGVHVARARAHTHTHTLCKPSVDDTKHCRARWGQGTSLQTPPEAIQTNGIVMRLGAFLCPGQRGLGSSGESHQDNLTSCPPAHTSVAKVHTRTPARAVCEGAHLAGSLDLSLSLSLSLSLLRPVAALKTRTSISRTTN